MICSQSQASPRPSIGATSLSVGNTLGFRASAFRVRCGLCLRIGLCLRSPTSGFEPEVLLRSCTRPPSRARPRARIPRSAIVTEAAFARLSACDTIAPSRATRASKATWVDTTACGSKLRQNNGYVAGGKKSIPQAAIGHSPQIASIGRRSSNQNSLL